MIKIQDWVHHDKLEFENEKFQTINLMLCKTKSNEQNFDFNTELIFRNCRIECFIATAQVLGRPITFDNCQIGEIRCHATYFCQGLTITDCLIQKDSTFDCGVHNKTPCKFVIERSVFNGHVDFFDIYFEGPVLITDNHFQKGTSLCTYLGVPYGIKEGVSFIVENNKGELEQLSMDDPYYKEGKN